MRIIKSLLNSFTLLLFLVCFIFVASQPLKVQASDKQDLEKIVILQKKVAKGYSNKFCNSIGIGISKEGATRLTINENKESKFNPSLWFELASSGNKNLKKIDTNQLTDQIATTIVSDCGYAIGLTGQKGIESFKEYFTMIKSEVELQDKNIEDN